MANPTIQLSHGTLTRIGYLDVPIPADLVGLTEDAVKEISWAEPVWADSGQPRFGAATWIADIDDTRVALDPIMAADVILRATPETEKEQQRAIHQNFKDAGYPVESVDIVLLTHFDGVGAIGSIGEDGTWSPFFPTAKILVSEEALSDLTRGGEANEREPDKELEAFSTLMAAGHIQTFADGEEVLPGIIADVSGAHGIGHTVFNCALPDNNSSAAFIGHLAISPMHLVTGPCEGLHADHDAAYEVLQAVATEGRTLIGPLWPAPGFGIWNCEQLMAG